MVKYIDIHIYSYIYIHDMYIFKSRNGTCGTDNPRIHIINQYVHIYIYIHREREPQNISYEAVKSIHLWNPKPIDSLMSISKVAPSGKLR